jgi:hypothetical protein
MDTDQSCNPTATHNCTDNQKNNDDDDDDDDDDNDEEEVEPVRP